ncbi:MAG: iron chaperone [Propioniciclava sp.]
MTAVDDYIAEQGADHQLLLRELCSLVRDLVPEAGEKISWGMPTFTLKGNLVHIAAAKHHVGLYPGPEGVSAFVTELDELGLRHSKGAIQFPVGRPLPTELIGRIVSFRAERQRTRG